MKTLPYLKGLTVQEKMIEYGIAYIEEDLDALYRKNIRNNIILKVDTVKSLVYLFSKFNLTLYREEILGIIFKPLDTSSIQLLYKLYTNDAIFRDYVNSIFLVYNGSKDTFIAYLRLCIINAYKSFEYLLPKVRNELIGLHNGYYYFSVKSNTDYDKMYERVSL